MGTPIARSSAAPLVLDAARGGVAGALAGTGPASLPSTSTSEAEGMSAAAVPFSSGSMSCSGRSSEPAA